MESQSESALRPQTVESALAEMYIWASLAFVRQFRASAIPLSSYFLLSRLQLTPVKAPKDASITKKGKPKIPRHRPYLSELRGGLTLKAGDYIRVCKWDDAYKNSGVGFNLATREIG